MKNRTDVKARPGARFRTGAVRRAAVVSAALATLSALATLAAPAASAHAAAVPQPNSVTVAAHSPSGTCVRATVLAFQTRHTLGTADHLAEALGVALAHRHSACPALVDYLKQTSA